MTDTPTFRRPPVTETLLGVQFEPLSAMRVVHFGLFWELIRDRFGVVQEQAALEPQYESFGDDASLRPGAVWRVMNRPELPRVWYLGTDSPDGQWLLQLQNDRLIANWRRASHESHSYPRYDALRAPFAEYLSLLTDFAGRQNLGAVVPTQCEVTYVNQIVIPEGRTFGSYAEECFPIMSGRPSDGFLPETPERITFQLSYRIDGERGRLHIASRPSRLRKSGTEIIDLRLTARGEPDGSDRESVLRWFDVGHRHVVHGFKSFTSASMHELWGLEPLCSTP